jgi:hypothetical protein
MTSGLETPPSRLVHDSPLPPPFIQWVHQGARIPVFVVYDNVLLLAESEEAYRFWVQRFEQRLQSANIRIKYTRTHIPVPGLPLSFQFIGFEFLWSSPSAGFAWRIRQKSVSGWALTPLGSCKIRSLQRLMGILARHTIVHSDHMAWYADVRRTTSLTIHGLLTSGKRRWDGKSNVAIHVPTATWDSWASQLAAISSSWTPILPPPTHQHTIYLACDASGGDNGQAAYLQLSPKGTCMKFRGPRGTNSGRTHPFFFPSTDDRRRKVVVRFFRFYSASTGPVEHWHVRTVPPVVSPT